VVGSKQTDKNQVAAPGVPHVNSEAASPHFSPNLPNVPIGPFTSEYKK